MRRLYLGLVSAALLSTVCMAAETGAGSASAPGLTEDGRKAEILKAFRSLNTSNDADWTEGGLPAIGRMRELTGIERLSRADVSAASPGLTRANFDGAPTEKGSIGASDAALAAGPSGSGCTADAKDLPTAEELEQSSTRDVDAAYNAERRPYVAAAGEEVPEDGKAIAKRDATVDEILAVSSDPIMLLEAAVSAGMGERHSRNSELQTLLRGYQVSQGGIKAMQRRQEERMEQREKSLEVSARATKLRESAA